MFIVNRHVISSYYYFRLVKSPSKIIRIHDTTPLFRCCDMFLWKARYERWQIVPRVFNRENGKDIGYVWTTAREKLALTTPALPTNRLLAHSRRRITSFIQFASMVRCNWRYALMRFECFGFSQMELLSNRQVIQKKSGTNQRQLILWVTEV